MQLCSLGSHAELPQAFIKTMPTEKYYIITMPVCDDSGEESYLSEIVWFHVDSIPGQMGTTKLFRFSKAAIVKRPSELPGARYYGPFDIRFSAPIEQIAPVVDTGFQDLLEGIK